MPKRSSRRSTGARKMRRSSFRKGPFSGGSGGRLKKGYRRGAIQRVAVNGIGPVINASRRFNQGSAWPNQQWTTHRYSSGTLTLGNNASTGLNGTDYYFRLSSLFAPDLTGSFGPHQPYQYDQLRSLYITSCVVDAQVTLTMVDCNARTNCLIAYIKSSSDVAAAVGETVEQWTEKPNAYTIFPGLNSQEYQKLTLKVNIAEVFGLSDSVILKDDRFWGIGNNNPTQTVLLGLSMGDINLTANQACKFFVTIDYRVRWSDPVTQGSS